MLLNQETMRSFSLDWTNEEKIDLVMTVLFKMVAVATSHSSFRFVLFCPPSGQIIWSHVTHAYKFFGLLHHDSIGLWLPKFLLKNLAKYKYWREVSRYQYKGRHLGKMNLKFLTRRIKHLTSHKYGWGEGVLIGSRRTGCDGCSIL